MKNNKIKISSNRSFGIVFFVVFFVFAIWPLLNNQDIRIWSLIISLVFLILGILNSNLLKPLNIIWFKFGLLLGSIIAPIIMGIVFFVVVTPTSLIMKIIGKDLLNNKYDKNKKSYWIIREKNKSTMKQQF